MRRLRYVMQLMMVISTPYNSWPPVVWKVTGIVDVVSMCVAIQYTHSVLFDDIVYSAG